MKVVMQDYEAGMEIPDPVDPTAPEAVEREFMDKLAELITAAVDMAALGEDKIESDAFYMARGEFLDQFGDKQVADWLKWMRTQNRCGFQTYRVNTS